jgi:hypothetical protein
VPEDLKDLILSTIETSLQAQLQAVRRLRRGDETPSRTGRKRGRSQVDMAYDILSHSRSPLHISELIDRIETAFGVRPDRESLVSALTKKVRRNDRFTRPASNTFTLREKA